MIWPNITIGTWATSLTCETSSNQWIHLSEVIIIYYVYIAFGSGELKTMWIFFLEVHYIAIYLHYNLNMQTQAQFIASFIYNDFRKEFTTTFQIFSSRSLSLVENIAFFYAWNTSYFKSVFWTTEKNYLSSHIYCVNITPTKSKRPNDHITHLRKH